MEQENSSYSEESDCNNRPEKPSGGGATTARSYDCSFCKRGFTNAQALGGHMNIHRKDKEKEKAQKKKSTRGEEDPLIQSFFPQVYMPPTNPSLHRGSHEHCFFPAWRPDSLQDRFDGSLSSRFDEDEEEEVDLELRLGRVFDQDLRGALV